MVVRLTCTEAFQKKVEAANGGVDAKPWELSEGGQGR